MNNVPVLELNLSPKFALMKQVVLNVKIIRSMMFSSSSKNNEYLRIAIFYQNESSKINK